MAIHDLRKSYEAGTLEPTDLTAEPTELLQRWLQNAIDASLPEPTAMTLATADAEGRPSARMVLLKGVDREGFRFYTNYESRKGREIAGNAWVALCFYWFGLERQVRIEGRAERLPREASAAYFESRPYGSQLGALVSPQSEPIEGREPLEARLAELEQRYPEGSVPLPDAWGGYLVRPHAVEFWQGRKDRLHDRFRYTLQGEAWSVVRLAP